MSRSKWKGFFICFSLYKKYLLSKTKHKFITIYNKNSTVLSEFIGLHFKVYNGVKFLNVFITENKIGFKFGEFVYTRKLRKFIHTKNNIKKK